MIPAEAVEAALRIYNPSITGASSDWQQHHQRRMRAALEAAAPYIAAEAWDRAAASIIDEHGNPVMPTNVNNPYRSNT